MNHIIASIYLGNIVDGEAAKMDTLYVHENIVENYTPTHHVPIIQWSDPSTVAEASFFGDYYAQDKDPNRKKLVSQEQLARAHEILDEYHRDNKPLLIHCLGGIERSPLTLATWIVRTKWLPDLDTAYEFLKAKRSVVEDRRHWLEQPI